MPDRIHEGLTWLAAEFSATADEFRKAHQPGGDMLLTGCVSQGFVRQQGGRYAVSPAGRRRIEAMEQPEPADAD